MPLAEPSAPQPIAADGDDADWIARRMVLDAGAQAARLRRHTSAQAATICEVAEREAELIWQRASVQAAAIREAAERDAAQLRAHVMKLSAEPATESEALPGPRPARRPPPGPPRQLVAIRVAAAATAALFLLALTAGVTEVALHGFAFFVFRSAGTGETRGSGLQEDQGPGQPDAPKPASSHITVLNAHSAGAGKKGGHGG
jgi:hypothetical protein